MRAKILATSLIKELWYFYCQVLQVLAVLLQDQALLANYYQTTDN